MPVALPSVFGATGARLDNSLAFYREPAGGRAFTDASVLGASYRVRPGLAVAARIAWVFNDPATGDSQTTISNPAVAAALTIPLGHGFFLGTVVSVAIPVGMGGGNTPDPDTRAANRAGFFARSALDQFLFAPNYLAMVPIVSAAWLGHGVTVQASVALSQSIRTRGSRVSPDAWQTAAGAGLHLGYYLIPELSLGAEGRCVWAVTTTPAVKADSSYREQASAAVGVRGHFKLGAASAHPGLSYTRGIDAPMSRANYHILGVDLLVGL
jgi:hypothetical protein